jgi:hypothetical protein
VENDLYGSCRVNQRKPVVLGRVKLEALFYHVTEVKYNQTTIYCGNGSAFPAVKGICINYCHELGSIQKAKTNLFHSENVMVKIELEFLVCVIDTELFEAILLEHFKAKDIQDTN